MKVQGARVELALTVVLLGVGMVAAAPSDLVDLQESEGVLREQGDGTSLTNTERDDKVFVVLLKIQPDQCTTTDTTMTAGTCLPAKDCTNSGGTASGTCAKGFGVCCIAQRRCGSGTSYNNTYFVNPGYPSADTGTAGACLLTVNRVNNNICQLRLDMIDFELSQPDTDGNCNTDFLTVAPATAPRICGSNDGQHMYVNVDPNGGPVKVTVDRSAASTVSNRMWNIKVSQIPCDSPYRAPSGCLQYYTASSGTVSSFNFMNTIPTTGGTRQLSNLNYGVCVEMADGYCGIIWERNTTGGNYGFTVSDNAEVILPENVGNPASGSTGAACTTDYVIIPGGVDDTMASNDRFCGLGFPNMVTSTMKPFVLYVNQDANEAMDFSNRGFNLNYRQITTC
ncbi:uncharacterized protein [Panulirus ornatus]|uniref:uncharacterized protein n=1 Tax=Panulirus ornatus TaxID=150431 RepID=UPI003A8C253A